MQDSFLAKIIWRFVLFQIPKTSLPRGNNFQLRRKEKKKTSFHKAWETLSSWSTVVSAGTNSTAWRENELYSCNLSAPIQTWQHLYTKPKTTQKGGEAKQERFDKHLCSLKSIQLPLRGLENASEKRSSKQKAAMAAHSNFGSINPHFP